MAFKKGQGGRPKGAKNQTTVVLKEAVLLAGEKSGADTKGKDGLVGYLKRVADEDPKAFCGLLGRAMPLQVTGKDDQPLIPAGTVFQFVTSQQPDSENRT